MASVREASLDRFRVDVLRVNVEAPNPRPSTQP